MKLWRRKDEGPTDEDQYLTEDRVELLAGELLDDAYRLAVAGSTSPHVGLAPPADLRVVLGARDVVAWRVQQQAGGSADVRAYGLVDELLPPDLRVPLELG
jgi:hypothetical protein